MGKGFPGRSAAAKRGAQPSAPSQPYSHPGFSPCHLPRLQPPFLSISDLSCTGAGGWQFFSCREQPQKTEIISLLCWQLRKWQFFVFPIQEFLPIGQRPHMPVSPQKGQGRGGWGDPGRLRTWQWVSSGQVISLAKRHGLQWSCGGRGPIVGGRGHRLSTCRHKTGTGREVKATGNLESLWDFSEIQADLVFAAAPFYVEEARVHGRGLGGHIANLAGRVWEPALQTLGWSLPQTAPCTPWSCLRWGGRAVAGKTATAKIVRGKELESRQRSPLWHGGRGPYPHRSGALQACSCQQLRSLSL